MGTYPRTNKALSLVFRSARKEIEDATTLSKVLDRLLVVEETLNGSRKDSSRKSKV